MNIKVVHSGTMVCLLDFYCSTLHCDSIFRDPGVTVVPGIVGAAGKMR